MGSCDEVSRKFRIILTTVRKRTLRRDSLIRITQITAARSEMQVCPVQDTEACIPKSEMQALLFDSGDWRVTHIIRRHSNAALALSRQRTRSLLD